MKLAIATWLGLGAFASASGLLTPEEIEGPDWRVHQFVVDGRGIVWGMVSRPATILGQPSGTPLVSVAGSGQDAGFMVLDAAVGRWSYHRLPVLPTTPFYAKTITVLSDGSVACLSVSGGRTLITRHSAGKDVRWCMLEASFDKPRLLPLSDGGLVITERGPKLARIPADGLNPVVTSIAEDKLVTPAKIETILISAMTHAVECGDGSICLWNYALSGLDKLKHIDGLLRWSGRTVEPVRGLPFKAGSSVTAIVADGKEHLFVAESGGGLWRLHWPDAKGTKVVETEHALDYIEKLTFIDGVLHIVTCPQPTEHKQTSPKPGAASTKTTLHYDSRQWAGTLWRMDDGKLKVLLTKLDANPRFGWEDRPIVNSSRGLLVGSADGAPWWLPAGANTGKPTLLLSDHGFRLANADDLRLTPRNNFFARGADGRWAHLPLPGIDPPPIPSRMATLNTRSLLLQDSRNHVWAMRAVEKDIAEFDGHTWNKCDTPNEAARFEPLEFAADGYDHGWMVPLDDGKCPVLDFISRKMVIFDSMERAVEQMLVPGDRLRMSHFPNFAAISHKNGDKAFLAYNGTLHVLHRGKWVRCPMREIASPGTTMWEPPFFDDNGRLVMPTSAGYLQLRDDGKWVEERQAYASRNRNTSGGFTPKPTGCTVDKIISTSYDRHGVAWLATSEGELWKWLDGVAVQVKDRDRTTVLRPRTPVNEVITDNHNNAFLLLKMDRFGTHEYAVVLPVVYPPPLKPAAVERVDADSVVIRLPVGEGTWSRGRLDQTAWLPPTKESELKFNGLLPGTHRVEIQSFDSELCAIASVETLTFSIKAAGDDHLAQRIKQLSAVDLDTREAAARFLKKQGAFVLPRLKESLKLAGNDPDLRWWLSAIIQHIEMEEAKPK